MAEYLNNINILLIYIFLLLCIVIQVKSKDDYIPALIWTSQEFQERKNVDHLVMNKIKSDLFESYLMELLRGQKALIVLFLEHDLGTEDFEWGDENGGNYPFLSNLTVNSRVDYFRNVESPHRTVIQLYKGYKLNYFKPGSRFNFNEKDLVVVELQKIESQRSEMLRNHDHQIGEINRQLTESGRSWICIYTAKYIYNGCMSKQLNSWFVEEHLQEKPNKAISLYRDEFTGLTLMTKGSIQLYLPSQKSSAVKILEDYLGASVKSSRHKIDFVIWFLNYTLTFHLNQVKEEWKIEGAKLLNGNGDTLKLTLMQEDFQERNNCYVQTTELKSEEKPLVTIILSKYKFVRLKFDEEPCKKQYGFQLTFSVIVLSILTVFMSWSKMLDKLNFSENTSIIRIPVENLQAITSKTIL